MKTSKFIVFIIGLLIITTGVGLMLTLGLVQIGAFVVVAGLVMIFWTVLGDMEI